MITEKMIEAAARAWSGAPFPSKRSLDKARAALEAAERAAWRPVDEAQKDTIVLISHAPENWWRGKVGVGYVHSDYNGHKDIVTEGGPGGAVVSPRPLYTRPLPSPPEAPKGEE